MARKSSEAQKAYQREYYLRRKARRKASAGSVSGGMCCYCGRICDALTIEHIIPRSKGGSDESSNLRAACKWCNLSRGRRGIEEWRSSLARRIAAIPIFGAEQRAYLCTKHRIDIYHVSDHQLAEIVFAFEGRVSNWRERIEKT